MLGVGVILVLMTALVGPYFVDWTLYRSTFERYAERVLGHPVTVLGEADMRLLPAPSITFSDVRVGAAENPLLVVSRFQMQVELPPLMKGEVKVRDLQLDRPHLQLSLDESGRLDWLTAMPETGVLASLNADDVAFENVAITNGALSVVDARTGETFRFEGGNLSLSARSLEGPFKLDGTIALDQEPYSISMATGRQQENGSIRLKGQVTPTRFPVDLGLDGLLSHENASPQFEGAFNLSSIQAPEDVDTAWTLSGQVEADMAELEVPEFEYRFGPQERQLSMTGTADLVYSGARRFEVRTRSKQIDLDRLLGGGPLSPIDLGQASELVFAALSAVPVPDMDGAISLDVPALVVGGGLTQDMRLDVETALGGWRIARFAARAPGRTVIASQGDLVLSPNLTYRGNVSLSSQQPGAFVGWWRQAKSGATTLQPIDLEGRINVVPDGFVLENLNLALDGADADGAVSFRKRVNGNPIFSINLNADQLDIDEVVKLGQAVRGEDVGLRGVSERPGLLSDLEVSARVQADRVLIGSVEGKNIGVEAAFSDGDLKVNRLFAGDLAGAEVDVRGGVNNIFETPQGSLSGSLVASDLGGLVSLLKTVFPDSGLVDRVKQAAPYLVPARFKADLTAHADNDKSDVFLELDGEAGSALTAVSGSLSGRVDAWRDADVGLKLKLTGSDGGTMLRQFGFEVLPVDDLGEATVALSVEGRPKEGLSVDLDAGSKAASLGVSGTVRLAEDGDAKYDIKVSAATPDLAPVALLAGRVLPIMGGGIPVDLQASISGNTEQLDLTSIEGTFAGVTVDGSASGSLEPSVGETNRRFTGDLALSELDLRVLSEAILGPDQWFSAGDGSSIWPNGAFGATLVSDLDLTLQVSANRFIVADGLELENAATEMRLTPMMLRLDGLSAQYASGQLDAALAIRRSDAEGAVSGRIKLQDADVRRLVWTRNDRAVATGLLDLFLEFDGAGRSISAIVSGLNGGGTATVRDGALRGINPRAFDLVIRAADAGLELEDEAIKEAFVSHMTVGSLPFSKLEGTLSLLGGRISARNIVVDASDADIFGSVEADLNTFELDSDVTIRIDPGENAVTGAEPQVGMLFKGALDQPQQSVDIAPFSAFLTLRAFDQEVRRVEKLQAEILERDRLLRELKRYRETDKRMEQAAAEAAAQEALEAEQGEAATGQGEEADPAADPAEQTDLQPIRPTDNASLSEISPDESAPATASLEQLAPAAVDASADGRDFSSRIRSIIEASDDAGGAPLPAYETPDTTETATRDTGTASDLPPLAAPETIEELLTLDIGTPTVSDLGADDSGGDNVVASEPAQRTRQTIQRRTTAPVQPVSSEPRYIQLPNGMVRENPNWSGN
nr:AsmA family protein [Roseibium sp. TrichSKD4]